MHLLKYATPAALTSIVLGYLVFGPLRRALLGAAGDSIDNSLAASAEITSGPETRPIDFLAFFPWGDILPMATYLALPIAVILYFLHKR